MSRGDHIKLIGEQEPPQQPTYPHTNIQFGALGGGFAIQILLADDVAITKAFNGQAEANLCDLLLERRKQAKEQAELVRNIEKSKLH